MPILRQLLERRSFDQPVASDGHRITEMFGSVQSVSGKRVTDAEAMRTSAVYACVRILSETIAALPAHVVRKDGQQREPQDTHPIHQLVAERPNPEMDAGEFWRFLLVYALFGGNGTAWVERNPQGRPVALWPVPASRVRIGRSPQSRELVYDINLTEDEAGPGHDRWFRVWQDDILHVKAFGTHRLYGASPIQAARESIGTARSAQDYAGRFYENDASPGGVISVEGNLTDEQFDRLNRQWKEAHQGLSKAHMMALLENGAQWHQVGISPQDAEFIETRKFETREIARIFGLPPHMIGDVETSTSWGSGIEQQNIAFLQYSLMPWIDRLERAATRTLLRRGPTADDQLFVKWSPDALLRADIAARYQAYAIGKQWGFESTNSILALEDRPPVDGGDDYLVPENMRRMLGDGEEDTRDLQRRIEAAGALIRAGFQPASAAARLDLEVEHLGVLPVTVQAQRAEDIGSGASGERSAWDPLPAGHPEHHLQCSRCQVVYVRESDARDCEARHGSETRSSEQVRTSEVDRHLDDLADYFGLQRDELLSRMGGTASTVADVWDIDRWDDELASRFRRLAGVTAAAFAAQVDGDYDADEELGDWLAKNSRIAAEEVNRSTREYLDGNLDSAEPGEEPSDVLRAAYTVVAGATAAQIARTRVTAVGQRAQQDAAEKSSTVTEKTWLVTSDNPRESHALIDGETVPVGERFSNGARYPGDPDLPVDERAGCTCDMQLS